MISSYQAIFWLKLYACFAVLNFLIYIVRFVICVNLYYYHFLTQYHKFCFSVQKCVTMIEKNDAKAKRTEEIYAACLKVVRCTIHLSWIYCSAQSWPYTMLSWEQDNSVQTTLLRKNLQYFLNTPGTTIITDR